MHSKVRDGRNWRDHVVIGAEPPQCGDDSCSVWGKFEPHEWLARCAASRKENIFVKS